MQQADFQHNRFLVIGGASKAGTTSLFRYLAAHPRVRGSSIKETRFFLDDEYPLPRKTGLQRGIAEYRSFFPPGEAREGPVLFVESTPDYLYCDTARKIPQFLPDAKFVFVLRDPVARFLSWYGFGKQIGGLPESLTLEEYFRKQASREIDSDTPVEWRALEQGRYAKYLHDWYETIPPAAIHVVLFEDLTQRSATVMRELCDFAALDAEYYDDFEFETFNSTVAVRSQVVAKSYNWLRRNLAYTYLGKPKAWNVLARMNRVMKKIMTYNQTVVPRAAMPDKLAAAIYEYYRDDVDSLEAMLGRSLGGWKR